MPYRFQVQWRETENTSVAQCTSQSAPDPLIAGTICSVRTFQSPGRVMTIAATPMLSVSSETSSRAARLAAAVSRKVDAVTATEPLCSRANGADFPTRSSRTLSVSPGRNAETPDTRRQRGGPHGVAAPKCTSARPQRH